MTRRRSEREMSRPIDLTGRCFDWIQILSKAPNAPDKRTRWYGICMRCGTEKPFKTGVLMKGCTRSCGCLGRSQRGANSRRHGFSRGPNKHPLYNVWLTMRERCANPKCRGYRNYGARGIRVCERWNDFQAFLADMGPKPSPEHSI